MLTVERRHRLMQGNQVQLANSAVTAGGVEKQKKILAIVWRRSVNKINKYIVRTKIPHNTPTPLHQ